MPIFLKYCTSAFNTGIENRALTNLRVKSAYDLKPYPYTMDMVIYWDVSVTSCSLSSQQPLDLPKMDKGSVSA